MVWVGLIQAYLLMAIVAVLLVLGSGQTNARIWNVIGDWRTVPLSSRLSVPWMYESLGGARKLSESLPRSTLSGSVSKHSQYSIRTRATNLRSSTHCLALVRADAPKRAAQHRICAMVKTTSCERAPCDECCCRQSY